MLDPLLALVPKDRQVVRAALELRDLAERQDVRLEGYVVVHDADCPAPQGACAGAPTCRPLPIFQDRRRR